MEDKKIEKTEELEEKIIQENLSKLETEQSSVVEELYTEVVAINRVTRVTAGGKRFRFRVLAVCGNKNGMVGIGVGKAPDLTDAINKATNKAKKNMFEVPIENDTIPFPVEAKWHGAHVYLKPSKKGSGVMAGSVLRAIFELAGIKNISGKIIASSNKINNAYATVLALKEIKKIKEIRDEFRRIKTQNQTKKEKKSR